ncbi:uncharacterized protein LOC106130774 [Amyelois transitella]|uniref:uncharacterized protein LOC106130774 n=1 Tax=Amyelois transitella TaxID=680683 RepID=UPI00299044B7|nr:uncharacterized protein LOC106130774 [Amyelois transitella]
MAAINFFLVLCLVHTAFGKGSEAQVDCTPEVMKVTVPMDGDRQISYLDQMKNYQPCKPVVSEGVATFMLDLQDHHRCGVTRIVNQITGKRTFYHKIVIENSNGGRETVTARCVVTNKLRALTRRAVEPFPLDFNEPDAINITRYQEGMAPDPVIGAVVKENGKQVSGEISVSPGTPLSMEIFLNEESAKVYGLLVSYMHVTDTGKQQETIILNGCSVDPYLFDNFLTTDGDLLAAKFRAFKFPDTTYVQFKGTVSVCLDKCQGVQCTNGATGYGRRRRSVSSEGLPNKLYEVSLTTFIRVDAGGGQEAEDILAHLKNLKIGNQMLGDADGTPASISEWSEESKLVLQASSANICRLSSVLLICLLILFK